MRHTAATPTGRLARWLLLACTLIGLAAMHSLGHGGGMHAAAMLDGRHHAAPAAVADATGGCATDGCAHLSAPAGTGDDMVGWSVCLAVLGGFAVVLLLAAVMTMLVRRYDAAGVLRGGAGAGPRAPPGLLPVGLTLATVSVLRT